MHFSKTYSQLLLTLPPALRDNAIQYRQLKKLIKQVVRELSSLGLGPIALRQLLEQHNNASLTAKVEETQGQCDKAGISDDDQRQRTTVIYELAGTSAHLEPHLRQSTEQPTEVVKTTPGHMTTSDSILEAIQLHPTTSENSAAWRNPSYSSTKHVRCILRCAHAADSGPGSRDLTIPLQSDTTFFQLLMIAHASLAAHLNTVHDDFKTRLQSLAHTISTTARPASSSAPRCFSTYSMSVDDAASWTPSPAGRKTDLYPWREIFQMYLEEEIFESVGERHRGERSIEESERRIKRFQEHMRGKRRKLKLPGSKDALDVFMQINFFILDLKKFQFANAEATRKILKKHSKRTALPHPSLWIGPLPGSLPPAGLALSSQSPAYLPRLLVQAIGEILLPIVPHVDDYSCLICTGLAFKPIRLSCSHVFCVRCLITLQKLGKPKCPMCRAPTVLHADGSNVDYALLNFMADWFPRESRAKQSANQREAAREQLEELGISGKGCILM